MDCRGLSMNKYRGKAMDKFTMAFVLCAVTLSAQASNPLIESDKAQLQSDKAKLQRDKALAKGGKIGGKPNAIARQVVESDKAAIRADKAKLQSDKASLHIAPAKKRHP